MKSIILLFLVFFILLFSFSTPSFSQSDRMLGFTDAGAAQQRALEARFDASIDTANLRAWMKRLTARPHHTGSPYDKENAEFIAAQFRSWGYETKIEEFHVLFPTPKKRVVELLEPERFTPSLMEPPLKEDATSAQTSEQLPPYNAYSVDGDATGELVYVNYGVPSDYEELGKLGVDVKGKIVIARYGGSWRGIKPKVAAEHGALGCIIYSDPRDDGYYHGDVYPKGAFRNEYGAQRGSVADMPLHSGDVLTPFIGATKNAKRLAIKDAEVLTKIPVLPISFGDALPLLRAIGGPMAPEGWRGSLPISYHVGPGPAKVRLALEFNWDIVPIYDVVAKLEGSEHPDQWIIRGNHHDAWVNGAEDPISGMVATMEEARAVADLVKSGWRPKRTIIYCAWDAEEQGLMGSTEWVETHADELKQKAVVYINSDSNNRGFLSMGGSHSLEKFMNQIGHDVVDPQMNIPVIERARSADMVFGSPDDKKDALDRTDLRLYPLGSGSDYTPFIQHLGIAALNIGYGGEGGGGSYHSVYDSYDHYTRFGDPSFLYGKALAQTTGRAVLRLANAGVLPFEFTNAAETFGKFIDQVIELSENMRKSTEEQNTMISDRRLEWAADPTKPFVVPRPKDPVPHLNFAPLRNAITLLERSAEAFEHALTSWNAPDAESFARVAKSVNAIVMKSEQALTREEGLPRRPWFVHQIYAPGQYTGYGVKTLPAVREAIEQRKWREAEEQIALVAETIAKYAKEIDGAADVLRSAKGK